MLPRSGQLVSFATGDSESGPFGCGSPASIESVTIRSPPKLPLRTVGHCLGAPCPRPFLKCVALLRNPVSVYTAQIY